MKISIFEMTQADAARMAPGQKPAPDKTEVSFSDVISGYLNPEEKKELDPNPATAGGLGEVKESDGADGGKNTAAAPATQTQFDLRVDNANACFMPAADTCSLQTSAPDEAAKTKPAADIDPVEKIILPAQAVTEGPSDGAVVSGTEKPKDAENTPGLVNMQKPDKQDGFKKYGGDGNGGKDIASLLPGSNHADIIADQGEIKAKAVPDHVNAPEKSPSTVIEGAASGVLIQKTAVKPPRTENEDMKPAEAEEKASRVKEAATDAFFQNTAVNAPPADAWDKKVLKPLEAGGKGVPHLRIGKAAALYQKNALNASMDEDREDTGDAAEGVTQAGPDQDIVTGTGDVKLAPGVNVVEDPGLGPRLSAAPADTEEPEAIQVEEAGIMPSVPDGKEPGKPTAVMIKNSPEAATSVPLKAGLQADGSVREADIDVPDEKGIRPDRGGIEFAGKASKPGNTGIFKAMRYAESNDLKADTASHQTVTFGIKGAGSGRGSEFDPAGGGNDRKESAAVQGVREDLQAGAPAHVNEKNASEPGVEVKAAAHGKGSEVFEKLGYGLKMSLAHGAKEVRISLSPEHLGQMHIKIKVDEGMVKANILVDNPAVKSILDADAGRLKDVFGQHGLVLDKYSIEINTGGSAMSDSWGSAGGSGLWESFEEGAKGFSPEGKRSEETHTVATYARSSGDGRRAVSGVDIFI